MQVEQNITVMPPKESSFACLAVPMGFSMIEICIVMMMACALAGFALINMNSVLPTMHANEAMNQTISQLRRGRQLAIAQRRSIQLNILTGTNQIQLVRNEPNGTTAELSMVSLGNNCRFMQFSGISADTPDGFGNSSAVYFGSASSLTFLSNGTLVDQTGAPQNGSVFLGLPGHPEAARAVTVLGATGRIQGYRWNSSTSNWVE